MRRLCCIAAGSPKNEDNPLSWSVTYPEDVGGGCSCTPMQNFCRLPENTTCYDVVLTDTVIADLHEHQTNSSISSMPFFLGLGVHKPHLPWAVPGSFFDLCKFQPPAYSSGSLVAQQTTWRNASLSVTLMVFRCDFKSNESECAVCCRLQTRR